jgi:hypothetical protein
VHTPTLEDVFLKYTGAKLSGDERPAEANGEAGGRKKRRKRNANVKISDEHIAKETEVVA